MTFVKIINFFIILVATASAIDKANYTTLLSSNIETTVIQFQLEDYNLLPVNIDNNIHYVAKFKDGASLLKTGAPDIQKYSKSIIIPDDAKMKIDILSSNFSDYQNVLIAPSKGNFSRLINPNTLPFEFGEEYNNDHFFPKEIARLQDPYILKNLRGQVVEFYPIQYNPVTKVLRVYNEITIEISNTSIGEKNILNRKSGLQKIDREYKNIYEGHFLNFNNDNRFDYLDDRGNMLIISYGTFIDEMEPFVNWKNKKGIPTEIIDVDEIGTNSNDIKSFVENYYYENGLTFLLLVGDVAQIPSPSISGSASDPSYGFIEGNDSYAEVIVGRFSGSIPSQIATQVERTIDYERYPQSGANWYDNAMGIASNQGPGFGGYSDDEFNDFLWNTVLSDFTYDSYQYSYDGRGSVTLGSNIIKDGVSIINYTGHGSIYRCGN